MERLALTTCPLDCGDVCGLVARVEDGRVVALEANPGHPYTRGFTCVKGRYLLDRAHSPARLTRPLLKRAGTFMPISWPEALDLFAAHLRQTLQEFGPLAIVHYTDSGSQGILKDLDSRFFARLGGATVGMGSLCNSAGNAAQRFDFGERCAHAPADVANAATVVLWGKNPIDTGVHTVPFIEQAKSAGAKVILIDPIRSRSAKLADLVVQPRPGTDAALAQAIARELIASGRYAAKWVTEHVLGFDAYQARLEPWTLARCTAVTGLSETVVRQLVEVFASPEPVAVQLGYGLQRYRHGGATVRAIDALAAISGNIGRRGGGVSYGNAIWRGLLADISGADIPHEVRGVRRACLGDDLLALRDPAVRLMVFARCNPVCQAPSTARLMEALAQIPFKVVFEHFMTDTAACADLVLPATTFLEEEDVYYSSPSTHLGYGGPAEAPLGECRSELEVYQELAHRLGLGAEFDRSPEDWLRQILTPLASRGITLERLRADGFALHPQQESIPYADGHFPTPSGRVELYCHRAAQAGLDPLAGVDWKEAATLAGGAAMLAGRDQEAAYPYHLLSPQPRHRLHSQFAEVPAASAAQGTMAVRLHPETAATAGVNDGELVRLESPTGTLELPVRYDAAVLPSVLVLENGNPLASGVGLNHLTPASVSDMGAQAAFYDCRCRLRKAR